MQEHSTNGSWKIQIWTVWVNLYIDFFSIVNAAVLHNPTLNLWLRRNHRCEGQNMLYMDFQLCGGPVPLTLCSSRVIQLYFNFTYNLQMWKLRHRGFRDTMIVQTCVLWVLTQTWSKCFVLLTYLTLTTATWRITIIFPSL